MVRARADAGSVADVPPQLTPDAPALPPDDTAMMTMECGPGSQLPYQLRDHFGLSCRETGDGERILPHAMKFARKGMLRWSCWSKDRRSPLSSSGLMRESSR
jgi:hypothetical protein